MAVEVDQSGKVEDTARATVLAYSNSTRGAVIISSKEKRKIQEMFRRIGAPRLYVDYTFSVLLILLIEKLKVGKIVVDIEYPGHTKIINSLVVKKNKVVIDWKRIGKNSNVHDYAYKVYKGKIMNALIKRVRAEEVWKIATKITGGYLKTGLSPANRHPAPVNKESVARNHR